MDLVIFSLPHFVRLLVVPLVLTVMGRRKRTHTRQPSIIRSSVDQQFSPSKQTDDIQIDMGRDIDMGNTDDIDTESSDTDESQAGLPSP